VCSGYWPLCSFAFLFFFAGTRTITITITITTLRNHPKCDKSFIVHILTIALHRWKHSHKDLRERCTVFYLLHKFGVLVVLAHKSGLPLRYPTPTVSVSRHVLRRAFASTFLPQSSTARSFFMHCFWFLGDDVILIAALGVSLVLHLVFRSSGNQRVHGVARPSPPLVSFHPSPRLVKVPGDRGLERG